MPKKKTKTKITKPKNVCWFFLFLYCFDLRVAFAIEKYAKLIGCTYLKRIAWHKAWMIIIIIIVNIYECAVIKC